ncbi:major facilitator superfamily domain-containing protein 8-like isoform X2 [Artemia franciscana]
MTIERLYIWETDEPQYVLETPEDKRKRRISLLVVYITAFSFSLGFSIVLTGVFPYLLQLDGSDPTFTEPKVFFGWVVASFPLGQLIASPLAGYVGKRFGTIRIPLFATLFLFTAGMVFYAMLGAIPPPRRYWMLGSRFVTGMAAATVALSLSYASQATTEAERTTGISIVNFSQTIGFMIGPVIQSALTGIGCEGISMGIGDLSFNMYTAAAWIAACLGVLNMIVLLPGIFTEYNIAEKERAMMSKKAKDENRADLSGMKPDYVAVGVCLVTFAIIIFNFIFTETLATPMAIDNFAWTEEEAVAKVGIMLFVGGIISSVCFLFAGPIARKIGERNVMIVCGFIPLIAAGFAYFPYSGPPPVERGNNGSNVTEAPILTTAYSVLTTPWENDTVSMASSHFVSDDTISEVHHDRAYDVPTMLMLYGESQSMPEFFHLKAGGSGGCGGSNETVSPGCPYDEQPWCEFTPAVKVEQFYIGYMFTSIGYPFGIAMVNSLYAKLLGPISQHVWMGFLSASGAFSRVLGPILVSYLYTYGGSQWTFGVLTGLMVINLAILLILYKKLQPKSYIDDGKNVKA